MTLLPQRPSILALVFLSGVGLSAAATPTPVDFVREVRPILEKHCYDCHGPEKQKSGYRLDLKQIALHEGDNHAPNIVPGASTRSPLVRFITGAESKMMMPPVKSSVPKLTSTDLDTLKRWIDEGAVWPEGVDVAKTEDRMDWWAFKPLQQVAAADLPTTSETLDTFIQRALASKGLTQASLADRRTLIRRLSYDLAGLPPSSEELAAFLQDPDSDARAYERLVDRLLASPRYGERWARHWLDVVHYGETHGYDKDKPRNNAWPYRDYVIRAFNEDRPYARFAEEQIAGDVLFPGTRDGMEALGFIAAGPWDLIGHAEVPESKIDGKIARHLDRDDMVQNTLGTFMSLTVGCAQCHNHKFDPITQEDYYSLQAVFAALDRADKKYYTDPVLTRKRTELEYQQRQLSDRQKKLEKSLQDKAGPELATLDGKITEARKATKGNASPKFGYHSALAATRDEVKWVQVDLGRAVAVDRVVVAPCYDDFNGIGAGFGFPVRYRVEVSDDPAFAAGQVKAAVHRDAEDQPRPGTALQTLKLESAQGRYVRFTATRLAERKQDYMLALAELQVLDEQGNNLATGGTVTSRDVIEAPPRWARVNLIDGVAPGFEPGNESRLLADLEAQRKSLLAKHAKPEDLKELEVTREKVERINRELSAMPAPQVVYAGTVHYGSGTFTGTGPSGGKPRPIALLKRGDVKTPDKLMAPGGIAAFDALAGQFACANANDEGARRVALAQWITSRDNPLFWRSMVNRVWQYHFGRGLVDTPNDFGRMGGTPSHPELLDWLARAFRDDLQGSVKSLHKLIVMSRTYRQLSDAAPQVAERAATVDADNRLLWRQNRRKLEAEAVRDAILSVSGRLDLTMGGPSFQDFVIEKPEHSPHYQYHLHDPNDPRSHRRSIYRFIVRSQQQPFMTVLDCADPSMRVDRRNESLSPLQALAMLNNGLTVAMAEHFAKRLEQEASDPEQQMQRAMSLALGREATGEEVTALVAHAAQHGLANTCRLILNLNEFTFVD
ncbi:PSD1 and planctomycete cytochrome C domain-containing protein [Verrucomicrobium sp. BvORR106]|uniref:PSD1 and planctomycete cytochrome C domain-containing protein n=1 Tax=Verrucomicrobium sp. BvORR106 TaxID=1403819 RepID=UPI002240ECD3|nr:PSD1 and planctomycete cytochrome C domain-containing protein [Verrucomicrobium sp. BvORR106]